MAEDPSARRNNEPEDDIMPGVAPRYHPARNVLLGAILAPLSRT